MFCTTCYKEKLDLLVKYGRDLGDKSHFYGLKGQAYNREVEAYLKVKHLAPYAKHVAFPYLQEWFEIMQENYEEPIVECENCKTKFSNNKNAAIYVNDKRYYACSGSCKGKISDVMRRREKNEGRKEALLDRIGTRL
jgi:hypothetical protein